MPQLDPASFTSQLFWLTVSFVVLYVLLARFLLPRVQSVLTLRAETISSDVGAASRMKTEAESARDSYEKTLSNARARAQQMFADAHSASVAHAIKAHAELDVVIEKKLAQADSSIRTATRDVMDKLAPVSAELAALIVEVLVNHKPNTKEMNAVIDALSKEHLA